MLFLENCTKADVFDAADRNLGEARVYWDSAYMYMLLEVARDFAYNPEEEYYILFYDPDAGLVRARCSLKFHSKSLDGLPVLSCTVNEVLETLQRRQDLKIPITTALEVKVILFPEDAADKLSHLPPQFGGTTVNLSAGGVYFFCPYQIPLDTQISLQLKLGNKFIDLNAVKVLRQEEMPPKKRQARYGHGCQFINITPQAESALRSYIFRCQREMRRR